MMKDDVPAILDNVQGITAQVNQFSGTLNSLPLQSTMISVQKTSDNLQQITNRLGLLLNDRLLYDKANGVLGSVDSLMIDLRLNPKRYVHFSLF